MSSQYYKEGNKAVLIKLGLDVDPAVAAAGAAGAAPFAGLIGEKKIVHDPYFGAKGRDFKGLGDLSKAVKPGDVLLTSKPQGGIWKKMIKPFTGSEFYHAQPVVSARGGKVTTVSPGQTETTLKQLQRKASPIALEMAEQGYPDVVVLRPKDTNITKGLDKRMAQRNIAPYDVPRAVKAWMQDVFVPKVEGVTGRTPKKNLPVCVGNVCSTAPALALEEAAGMQVVPGKSGRQVMPADFMRSKQFEFIGSHSPTQYTMPLWMRKASPYASRAALGAGLAGAAYGGVKQPEAPAAIGGAAATEAALNALSKRGIGKTPGLMKTLEDLLFVGGDRTRAEALKGFGLKRLPFLLAGGTAAGMGAHALRKALNEKRQEKDQ